MERDPVWSKRLRQSLVSGVHANSRGSSKQISVDCACRVRRFGGGRKPAVRAHHRDPHQTPGCPGRRSRSHRPDRATRSRGETQSSTAGVATHGGVVTVVGVSPGPGHRPTSFPATTTRRRGGAHDRSAAVASPANVAGTTTTRAVATGVDKLTPPTSDASRRCTVSPLNNPPSVRVGLARFGPSSALHFHAVDLVDRGSVG